MPPLAALNPVVWTWNEKPITVVPLVIGPLLIKPTRVVVDKVAGAVVVQRALLPFAPRVPVGVTL